METSLASTKDIAPGRMIGVTKDGKPILIANVAGTYYAIGNTCTHMGCEISGGTLTGDRAQCPCHGSTFDVKTGAVVKGPAQRPEPSYMLKIEGESIIATL
jgi:3-phenylpropionate/trans-cinnamate dioxygenase ferredoxin subunit